MKGLEKTFLAFFQGHFRLFALGYIKISSHQDLVAGFADEAAKHLAGANTPVTTAEECLHSGNMVLGPGHVDKSPAIFRINP